MMSCETLGLKTLETFFLCPAWEGSPYPASQKKAGTKAPLRLYLETKCLFPTGAALQHPHFTFTIFVGSPLSPSIRGQNKTDRLLLWMFCFYYYYYDRNPTPSLCKSPIGENSLS